MKNKLNFLLVITVMVFVIGCNCRFGNLGQSEPAPTPNPPSQPSQPNQPNQPTSSSNSNKTLTDHATDVLTRGEQIGIAECDELLDSFRTRIENENTDMITKAILKTLEGQFRQQLKQSLEQNNTDRTATAEMCKEVKKQLEQQAPQK